MTSPSERGTPHVEVCAACSVICFCFERDGNSYEAKDASIDYTIHCIHAEEDESEKSNEMSSSSVMTSLLPLTVLLISVSLLPLPTYVTGELANVAVNKSASQSSTFDGTDNYTTPHLTYNASAGLAVDGFRTKEYSDKTCAVTDWLNGQSCTLNPWWQVDLGKPYVIHRVDIYFKNNNVPGNVTVLVGTQTVQAPQGTADGNVYLKSLNLSSPVTASTVNISLSDCTILQLCEVEVYAAQDECESNPCHNGGTCRDGDNSYTCTCAPGFTGPICQTELGGCASSPCGNGTCIHEGNNYTCSCMPGFTGRNCSTDINHCAEASCGEGTCIDGVLNFTCICPPDFTGKQCETVTRCNDSVCMNGGTCNGTLHSYTCNCQHGFSGTTCSLVDPCINTLCLNGGTCLGSLLNQTCLCQLNYTGVYCASGVSLAAIIGGCIAAAVLVIALVLVTVIIKFRQRRARTGGKRFTLIDNPTGNGFGLGLDDGSSPTMEMRPASEANHHHESSIPHTHITPALLPVIVTKARNDVNFLAEEFEQLPRGLHHPVTVAMNEHNKGKNRYRQICAYDHSRVVLSKVAGSPHSDYINACYLDGYKSRHAYIAAQGPTDVNVEDFLRMIWEENVEKIAMLTRPTEMGQMKCVQYWKDEEKVEFGAFTVTVLSVIDRVDMTVRRLAIQPREGAANLVTHFLFKSWPDKGVPDSPWSLIDFRIKLMTSPSTGTAPILVHCSAGVGRTGTLVALDVVLQQLQKEGEVDFMDVVDKLRKDRMDLVQTLAQYRLLHEAALVGLCCAGRVVPLERFTSDPVANDMALVEEEFKAVEGCIHPLSPDDCSLGSSPDYRFANRSQDILPLDRRVVWFNEQIQDCVDYINAVYLPSYVEEKRYVLTQTPLPATVVNFWRTVFEADVTAIVSLDVTTPDLQADIGEYVPVDQPVLKNGPLTLKLLQSQSNEGYIHRTIEVTLEGKGTRTVEHCEVSMWPDSVEVPPDPGRMLNLTYTVLEWSPPGGGNIMVHCRDGSRRSGVYVALSTLLERSSSEAEVPVPYVVGVLSSVRPQALPSRDQYAFLYAAMMIHASNRSIYEQSPTWTPRQENATDENLYVNFCDDEDPYVNATNEDLYANAEMLK